MQLSLLCLTLLTAGALGLPHHRRAIEPALQKRQSLQDMYDRFRSGDFEYSFSTEPPPVPVSFISDPNGIPPSGTFNQNTIDNFNNQIAPGMTVGTPVDHSNDGQADQAGVSVDPFSSKYGGRTGLLVGDKNFRAGFYANPLTPQQPPILAVEGSFKE